MESSILKTVRNNVVGNEDDISFDGDLILAINSAFLTLSQLGVGPLEGFMVTSEKDKWDDFTDDELLNIPIRTYICRKAKHDVDPPSNPTLLGALKDSINELEWRLRHVEEIQNKMIQEGV